MVTVDYILPSYLACALINSDWGYLTEEKACALLIWIEDRVLFHGGKFQCLNCFNYGFTYNHNYTPEYKLGSDCQLYTFHVEPV